MVWNWFICDNVANFLLASLFFFTRWSLFGIVARRCNSVRKSKTLYFKFNQWTRIWNVYTFKRLLFIFKQNWRLCLHNLLHFPKSLRIIYHQKVQLWQNWQRFSAPPSYPVNLQNKKIMTEEVFNAPQSSL